ncbi:glutathione S-transferase family protein [Pseudokordiimonas caeni]|uniref:glutathione S-transferase family protein n=1 Tax=Pseudokordiimonas caeni TaxID=2997908 RepID=UPI0028112A4C|nr:glutathione S-transferase family protein [Pseudokordiimonas caeni]
MTSETFTLLQFPTAPGAVNLSCFCIKAEILLQMTGANYRIDETEDFMKMPKGKFPVLRAGDKLIPDSEFIRHYLEDTLSKDLDAALTRSERAVAHAFARMIEERLYWVAVYSRWVDPDVWPILKEAVFDDVPADMRDEVADGVQKEILRDLHGHGLGRHSQAEIYALGARDIAAIADFLGDKQWMMGPGLSSLDAVVISLLGSIMGAGLPSPLIAEIERHPNLAWYVERGLGRFFPAVQMKKAS